MQKLTFKQRRQVSDWEWNAVPLLVKHIINSVLFGSIVLNLAISDKPGCNLTGIESVSKCRFIRTNLSNALFTRSNKRLANSIGRPNLPITIASGITKKVSGNGSENFILFFLFWAPGIDLMCHKIITFVRSCNCSTFKFPDLGSIIEIFVWDPHLSVDWWPIPQRIHNVEISPCLWRDVNISFN